MRQRLFALRAWTLEGTTKRQVAGWLGILLCAGSVLFGLDDRLAPALAMLAAGAGATWLSGLWWLPWGKDHWYRRTVRAWTDCMSAVRTGQARAWLRAKEWESRLNALTPPPRFSVEHEELTRALAIDFSRPIPEDVPGRVESAARRLETAQAELRRISEGVLTDDERAYARQVEALVDARIEDGVGVYRGAEEAASRFARRLSEIRPVEGTATLHGELKRAMDDYFHVMASLHTAYAGRDFAASKLPRPITSGWFWSCGGSARA